MANVMNKIMNMLNLNTEEEEIYEDEEYDEIEEPVEEEPIKGLFGRKTAKSTSQVRMVIMQPTNFDSAPEICDLLRERKSIILNLEYVNKDIQRRIVDVVSGAVEVLDAHMKKINNSIFLIAPVNYDITSDVKEDVKGKLQVTSWLNND